MITNQTITQTVTLGSVNSYPTYASPLTITSTGAIVTSSGDGIDGGVALFGSINNAGLIAGETGASGTTNPGGAGIVLSGGGNITNSGTIAGGNGGIYGAKYSGNGGTGIVLSGGGGVVNLGAIDGGASSAEYNGLGGAGIVLSGEGSIVNLGTIDGGASPGEYAGLGGAGIVLSGKGSIVNLGVVAGGTGGGHLDGTSGAGIVMSSGGSVMNGSAGDSTAEIEGGIWAHGTAGLTITSFGSIAGEGPGAGEVAVNFSNAASVLILEGSSQLIGKAKGDGGTLDLAGGGGAGTLSGLGSQYTGFAQYTVLGGADWTLNGANKIGSGNTLTDAGRLTDFGTLIAGSGVVEVVSGGSEIVAAGGVGKGTIVRNGGTETVFGSAFGGTISSGGRQVVSAGGVASGGAVKAGGDQTVSSGGTARGTVLSGGAEYVRGTASGTIVDSGGTENVHGMASGGRVANGGTERVFGQANGGTVNSGGRQIVSSGGVASGVTVRAGGSQTVLSGGTTRTAVLSGGAEVVSAGGKASATIVDSGGHEYVHGTASGGTINSGGRQTIRGGVASGVTVKAGGSQTVFVGGTTRGTVLSGGREIVSAGGKASATIVDSAGIERVYGRASGGTIRGGLIEVANGGTATGTVTFVSAGTLQLDPSATFTGAIKGFGNPDPRDQIDLRRVAFGAGTTRSFTEAAGNTSGTLTVTDGTHTVHLTLLGIYTTNNFALFSDSHGGTRVVDPPIAGGGASQTTFADIAIGSFAAGWPRDARGSPGAAGGVNAFACSAAQTGGASLVAIAHGGYHAILTLAR